MKRNNHTNISMRISIVFAFLIICFIVIVVRAYLIQISGKEFYTKQGDMRQIRTIDLDVPRGTIFDRNGEPLAISTPMISIGINPSKLIDEMSRIDQLAEKLELDATKLRNLVIDRKDKKFIYIKRRIPPQDAEGVLGLKIPGVELRKEFKRFYPAGEIISQLIGFTDANDVGKEGIERAYDNHLAGVAGKKQVVQNMLGHVIKDVKEIVKAKPGKNINLSIDRRLQYVAYKALKTAVYKNRAETGAAVVLDINTGGVLAMVSQPSYNPNNKTGDSIKGMRNRTIQDMYEPGSVIKPFTIIAALLSGKYDENSVVDTAPFDVDGFEFSDARNYGEINLETILGKSSNRGTSKIALNLSKSHLWETFHIFGFGSSTSDENIGESSGFLQDYKQWSHSRHANIAFGYGMQVTTLQLATAYAAIANNGRLRAPSYLRDVVNDDKAIIDPNVAIKVGEMLQNVVTENNTGKRAIIDGYQVAGKTGTASIAENGGYSDKYIASFVGYAPADNPRIVVAVTITNPTGEEYGGGVVAAPVFKQIMQNSLRILNISPNYTDENQQIAMELSDGY